MTSQPRTLTDHHVPGAEKHLTIVVTDEPGAGGANHRYLITGFDTGSNASRKIGEEVEMNAVILFQNGTVPEMGINGVTHEALLTVVIDRLRSFQKGPFACKENACALTHLEEGLMWLQSRTAKRMVRGVEGTHTP